MIKTLIKVLSGVCGDNITDTIILNDFDLQQW